MGTVEHRARLRMAEAAIEQRQRGEEVPAVWLERRERARAGLG